MTVSLMCMFHFFHVVYSKVTQKFKHSTPIPAAINQNKLYCLKPPRLGIIYTCVYFMNMLQLLVSSLDTRYDWFGFRIEQRYAKHDCDLCRNGETPQKIHARVLCDKIYLL